MFVRIYFLLTIPLYAGGLCAQHLPDSLEKKFLHAPKDSNYVIALNSAASEYLKAHPEITRSIATHAMDVASEIEYTRGYARALTVMGNAYWYEGVYEFAQNYYLLAARQYQAIGDNIGLGYIYNNIGEVYKKLNENDKALQYLFKSISLKQGDSASQTLTLYNIAEVYLQQNKIDEARKYIDRSLILATKHNNQRVIAFNKLGLGILERKQKNYERALPYYLEAEKIWLTLGEVRSLIQTYQEIAELYREQQHYSHTERYLLKAMELASQVKVPDLQIKNYQRFTNLDSLRGNYKRALYYFRRNNELKDSVYTILKAEQIARLQTIYETEARDLENQQLRSEKEIRDAQLKSQNLTIIAITCGLVLAGVLVLVLFRQRRRISFQKEAIEIQAQALLTLNKELQELNKNLEARIQERTEQLIIQNQKITEYTFINAHKLRAPVASILGLINLLSHVKPEEKEPILMHLKTCGEQLDMIIREVSKNLESTRNPEK